MNTVKVKHANKRRNCVNVSTERIGEVANRRRAKCVSSSEGRIAAVCRLR